MKAVKFDGNDRRDEEKPRNGDRRKKTIEIDYKISLGQIFTAITFIIAVIAAYYDLKNNVSLVDQKYIYVAEQISNMQLDIRDIRNALVNQKNGGK